MVSFVKTQKYSKYSCITSRNAMILVYNGLTFYLPNLGGNPYLSLFFSGLIEVWSNVDCGTLCQLKKYKAILAWTFFTGTCYSLFTTRHGHVSWAEVQSDWLLRFNWSAAALNTYFAKRFILTSHISYSSYQVVVHSDISFRKGVARHILGNPR